MNYYEIFEIFYQFCFDTYKDMDFLHFIDIRERALFLFAFQNYKRFIDKLTISALATYITYGCSREETH